MVCATTRSNPPAEISEYCAPSALYVFSMCSLRVLDVFCVLNISSLSPPLSPQCLFYVLVG